MVQLPNFKTGQNLQKKKVNVKKNSFNQIILNFLAVFLGIGEGRKIQKK